MMLGWKRYFQYVAVVIVGVVLLYILIETIRAKNTGFETKTLWDWMELLIIPLVLAGGALYLQQSERAVERRAAEDRAKLERGLAADRQQEAALHVYLDRMAELLLKENLQESEDEKVLKVARVRTLTVMWGLNSVRNGIVLRFLHDIGLAGNKESTLLVNARLDLTNLADSNLAGTNLAGANLEAARLVRADLRGANLADASLQDADLERANLEHANLQNANLEGANLAGANLRATNFEHVNLDGANLKDATMPDGTKHD